MDKKFLTCSKCKHHFHYKMPTPTLIKSLLFFLPIKVYWCARCATKRYIILSDKEAKNYANAK